MTYVYVCKMVYSIILLITSAYQLFAPKKVYSKRAFVRYVVEFGTVFISYMVVCNASERLERCNEMVRRSIVNCNWHTSSQETQQGLIMILLRTYRAAYVRVLYGVVDINYVKKISYISTNKFIC
jgi:7tm Odorant receptor.